MVSLKHAKITGQYWDTLTSRDTTPDAGTTNAHTMLAIVAQQRIK